jgi:vancomycin aglycone glucosyltransferase
VRLPEPPAGAMLLDGDGPLPGEVEAFLGAGAPPVYIGFGSMPDAHPERTAAVIAEAVRLAGCRAIVRGDAKRVLGPALLTVGQISHAALFPRVALAVHHGGAGTCARAARAGIPQVIVPHLLDQFPWSARLMRRGLAPPPLRRGRLSSKALAGRDGADQVAEILSRAPHPPSLRPGGLSP